MTVSSKAALSLLISLLVFSVISIFAFTGLFDKLETQFYNPYITAYFTEENKQNAEIIDQYLIEMEERFARTLTLPEVKRSFLPNNNDTDIETRWNIYTTLIERFNGIEWVRFIDFGGSRLLFSSYAPDVASLRDNYVYYRNYSNQELPFETIAVHHGETPKCIFDGKRERILFSFPFYDSLDNYLGTALFSISIESVLNRLLLEERIRSGYDIMVVPEPAGLVFGISASGEKALPIQVSRVWAEKMGESRDFLYHIIDSSMVLISTNTSHGFLMGRIVNKEIFLIPFNLKIIILSSLFLTLFLVIFLLFNYKQDPVALVQNRMKILQVSIIEQFYELKIERDWAEWIHELEYRRKEVSIQMKKGIKPVSQKQADDIDVLISKTWDELLAVLGSRKEIGIDQEQFKSILRETLVSTEILEANGSKNTSILQKINTKRADKEPKLGLLNRASAIVKEIEETDEAEEIEELEELSEPESFSTSITGEIASEEPSSTPSKTVSHSELDKLASQIEFSPVAELESLDEEGIEEDLEVVSPFSSMLSNFSDSESADELDQLPNDGLPLIASPFQNSHSNGKIETLNAIPDDDDLPSKNNNEIVNKIIEEKEGLPYINQEALDSDEDNNLEIDKDLKNLVDSVIK